MTKQKSIMLSMAGVALLVASQVYGANGPTVNYGSGDLLVNFRDLTTPGTDLEIDLGNLTTFADGNVGNTVEVVSPTMLNNVYGAFGGLNDGDNLGFTAAAQEPGSTPTLFLTRTTSGAGVQGTASPQQGNGGTAGTAGVIDGIGQGAATSEFGTGVNSSGDVAADVGVSRVLAGASGSYDSLADAGHGSTVINFGGNQALGTGPLESTANDGGDVNNSLSPAGSFASLWEVPQSGSGSDTYLGYFTFTPGGELDYTGVNSVTAVPEPSTYALLVMTGLVALAGRRQIRSLTA